MDGNSIEISYCKDNDAFRIVLTSTSNGLFDRAALEENIRSKKEQELVAALRAFFSGRAPLVIERYKNEARHDGENGEPAVQSFDKDGAPVVKKHFKNGGMDDGPDDEPALQMFGRGKLVHAARWKQGRKIKALSETECAEYYWKWVQKNAQKAPADTSAGRPGSPPKP